MSRLRRLIGEVHRRSLWQVLGIYLVGAWIAYEVIQAMTEGLGLPHWLPGLAVALLIIGLPIVLATAFVQESTSAPAGKRDRLAEGAAGSIEAETEFPHIERAAGLLTWRNAILGLVGALALWGIVVTGWYLTVGHHALPKEAALTGIERMSIAVLPFGNIAGDQQNEAFTNGIHDDIITHLFKIGSLKVISRTSVMEYRETWKNVREIADDLGVRTLLEGSVQRVGDQVRINVQLIDAETDEHLWAEIYDRDLTIENIFSIQSDIAERIAAALKASLSPAEEARIEARPTDNLAAYESYVQGNEYLNRGYIAEDLLIAVDKYGQAIDLDPTFALAFAKLSRAYSALHFFHTGRQQNNLALAQEAADRALGIEADLAEAHLAMGYVHYWGYRDYDPALRSFKRAREFQPNNSDLILAIAQVERRQNEWDDALANFEIASELDPRSALKAFELGMTHTLLRNYDAAGPNMERALSLAPGWATMYVWKAVYHISRDGDLVSARETLNQSRGKVAPGLLFSDFSGAFFARAVFRTLHEDWGPVLDELTAASFGADTANYYLAKADLNVQRDQPEAARAYYDSAIAILLGRVQAFPDADGPRTNLGIAYAGVGRKEEAIAEANEGVNLLPLSKDAFYGTDPITYLAWIYTTAGEYDAAFDQLELLLERPSYLSSAWLEVDPAWEPLRSHPRFQELVRK